jgi:hypothetical protein
MASAQAKTPVHTKFHYGRMNDDNSQMPRRLRRLRFTLRIVVIHPTSPDHKESYEVVLNLAALGPNTINLLLALT